MKDILSLNKRAWDNIAKRYDDRSSSKFSDMFVEFTVRLPENGKVLDLGCGTGLPYAKYLVEMGFDVIGVDLSGEMVKVASENVPGGTFIQLSMSEIEYEEEFNGIMSSFSMLLLPPDLFKETASLIFSALTKGGYFFLSLNEPASIINDPDTEVIVNIMGQDMYSRSYTVEEIKSIFLSLGFSTVRFNRDISVSEEFGEEHVIEFILRN